MQDEKIQPRDKQVPADVFYLEHRKDQLWLTVPCRAHPLSRRADPAQQQLGHLHHGCFTAEASRSQKTQYEIVLDSVRYWV